MSAKLTDFPEDMSVGQILLSIGVTHHKVEGAPYKRLLAPNGDEIGYFTAYQACEAFERIAAAAVKGAA